MAGSASNRTALLAGGALAAAIIGVASASAQEFAAADLPPVPTENLAPEFVADIDFTDAQTAFRRGSVSLSNDSTERFTAPAVIAQDAPTPRQVEVEFAATDGEVDVAFAQRASLGAANGDDIDRRGRGSEVRIGRGLVEERSSGGAGSSTYIFVASDNEALTWQPGQRSDFGGRGAAFALQDTVEVGDMSVGVTYERNGIQASLAYVEREESTTVGTESFKQDQSFAGFTLTMRR